MFLLDTAFPVFYRTQNVVRTFDNISKYNALFRAQKDTFQVKRHTDYLNAGVISQVWREIPKPEISGKVSKEL
jgi:hypothetical protein